jgi:pyruvate/2-oxoacid:ferredoxin oxidoreductase beta subunit/Pyruvate/2-oxoacid:ferredoxin oxidoreductase gamma subunit
MTLAEIAVTPLATYRNASPYPFCPGCGHGFILDHLNKALVKLQLDPREVVVVTDIGCVGLSDQYFDTNAFHGLHGRSVAYATGIKLARPELKVIVLMGDGGCGIGGHHLINAARRNIGVSVLVFNNFNFGMTGGEHSVTTPHGGLTPTTRAGNLERHLDICATVAVNGAGLVYRGTSFDKDLPDRIADAIAFEGFSLLDIWELCTAYYVPNNDFSKTALMMTLTGLQLATGVLHQEERAEYAVGYREAYAEEAGKPALPVRAITPTYPAKLDRKFHIVVAGSAGGKVRSAARFIGTGGIHAGLWATQQDDYPTTVMSGHSVSEIILSPAEITYTGIHKPDALILLSRDGYKKVTHHLRRMTAADWLFVTPEFADVECAARKIVLDFGAAGIRAAKKNAALTAIAAAMRYLALYPMAAFEEAIRASGKGVYLEENLAALAESEKLDAKLSNHRDAKAL